MLIIFGATEIPWNFNFVIEGKAGRELPQLSRLELSERISDKKTWLITCRRQDFKTIKYIRFTFLEYIIYNSPKATRTKFLRYERFTCYISISKAGKFKNPYTITSLSQLIRNLHEQSQQYKLWRIMLYSSKPFIFMCIEFYIKTFFSSIFHTWLLYIRPIPTY